MEETGYMAKMRVHELAKELGIENKQIIEFLSTTEHAVKSHSSSIEDDVQKMVRDKFQKKAAPKTETAPKAEAAPKKEAAPKAEAAPKVEAAPKAAENAEGRPERPKKKSSSTAVFNPQYSKQGGGRRPQGDRDRRPMNGDRRPMNGDRRPQGGRPEQRQARPANSFDVKRAFERAINPEAAKAAEEAERQAAERAKAARTAAPESRSSRVIWHP